jgi:dihydroneopterin aldolase
MNNQMKTKIELHHMHFYAYHGVMPHEKLVGNEFEVSISLEADLLAACVSDDVNDTINYAALFDLVRREMQTPSRLLEHVAGRIFRRMRAEYPQISFLEVRVSKKHPPVKGEMEKAEIIIHT